MYSQIYYLVRSKADGQYLVAHPRVNGDENPTSTQSYLLLFREHYDALSYLNTHAREVADRFAIDSISGNQLETLLKRWNFSGVGIVQDPLLPKVEFLSR
ncbi:MAG: hypothetical protein ACP5RH_10340 [Leptodesmis sp.]|uniref:hypothetical protein n=1 Tax=Leptodesmis TaxID=2664261 RepID=UPI001F21CE2D|nr:hypothetical protein [Leptodesmis sichuanensis]UIE39225.1 hypothetical protein KIK02_06480 [Leptodesmis sichuanensis A121]